jgi:hypothetical protein
VEWISRSNSRNAFSAAENSGPNPLVDDGES